MYCAKLDKMVLLLVGVELMEVTFAVKSIEEGLCKFPMTDGLFSWEMKGFALKLSLGEDFPHFGRVPVWGMSGPIFWP